MKICKYFILIIIVISCENKDILSPDNDSNNFYATTFTKLDQIKLDSLNNKLIEKLGTNSYAQIDSFGFTSHHQNTGNIYDEYGNILTGSNIDNTTQAVSLAKSTIFKLNNFTNVIDTLELSVKTVERDLYNDWKIEFKNQIFKNLEVLNTEIEVKITINDFVIINGSNPRHYKNIIIPTNEKITKNKAKEILVGTEIEFICQQKIKFLITDESIQLEDIEKCIYPFQEKNTITLHTVWKVPVYYDSKTLLGWYYYIDEISGKIINYEQLFYCN